MLLYLGIFISTASLLFLEVFSIRIISVAISDSAIFYVIAMAMFGVGTAGALGALIRPTTERNLAASRASWLAVGASLAILLLFLGLTAYNDSGNRALDAAMAQETNLVEGVLPPKYMNAYLQEVFIGVLLVGMLMFVPYLLFGLILSILFRGADYASIPKMYAVDLAGACVGAVLAIVAMDFWQFSTAAIFATTLPLLAAIAFGLAADRKRMAFGFVLVGIIGVSSLTLGPVHALLEPQPHLGTLGRTQHIYIGSEVKELWRTWTSFGRIAAIELKDSKNGVIRTVMVEGAGEGHARVLPANQPIDESQIRPVALVHAVRFTVAGCDPKRVLVLMAGAGADMVLIDRLTGGASDISGVEIEPEVFTWPASRKEFGLDEFFARPNIHMYGAEGREFLARDDSSYDCILRSFAGASRGYFAGMTANAITPLLTNEGLAEMLAHLAPGGQVTLLRQRSSDLLTVSKLLRRAGRTQAQIDKAFALVATQAPLAESDYLMAEGGDLFFLLVKPDGFTEADTAKILSIAAGAGYTVLYAPYQPSREPTLVDRILRSEDPYGVANAALRPVGARIYGVSDNRPFADDEFPMDAYLTADFWLGKASPELSPRVNNLWKQKRRHLAIVIALAAGSCLLILAPLWISYAQQPIRGQAGTANHLLYFGALGAAFMFIEMGLIQQLQLLVGHPGHTIAIVLASLILFTGVGSYTSANLFRRRILTFRRAAFLAAGTAAITIYAVEEFMPFMVGLPRLVKLLLAFLIPVLPAFFMGQLYPQGLAALTNAERLIPLSMGMNAMTGTIAAGLGVALAQVTGFRVVVLVGIAIYVLVALMPHRLRENPRGDPARIRRSPEPAKA